MNLLVMIVVKEQFLMRGCRLLKEKNRDLDFIKGFNQISVISICKDKKIDNSNMYKRGKHADEIKKEIDKKIVKLYNNYVESGEDNERD